MKIFFSASMLYVTQRATAAAAPALPQDALARALSRLDLTDRTLERLRVVNVLQAHRDTKLARSSQDLELKRRGTYGNAGTPAKQYEDGAFVEGDQWGVPRDPWAPWKGPSA